MANIVTNGNCIKIGVFATIVFLISLLFLTKHNGTQFRENTSFTIDIRQVSSANFPEINTGLLKFANESNNFTEALKEKYGDVAISGIKRVSPELNPDEEKDYEECVKNGVKDRERNGSKFWSVQDIRRTYHTYLANENAVLIEVGGNRGDDASEFVRLFNPRYIILEPLEEYANILTKKFKDNPRVTVVNLGLGARNEVVMVKVEGNNACATSKFSGAGGTTPIYITNTTEFLLKIGVGLFDVELLSMNCEGCEFEALETILSTNLVKHLRHIQFATHSTIKGLKDPIQRYCKFQQLLWRTHRPAYQYRFIWESWTRHDLV